MKVVAIIQARMGSTRLPGKVLMDLAGEPMLARVVRRSRRATLLTDVVVATTTKPADDAIADACARYGWPCYRGSEDDVLDRYYQTAQVFKAEVVARITSDCPLIEPSVVDRTVKEFLDRQPGVDYACNFMPQRTFPRGLDVEVMNRDALSRAWRDDRDPAWREHVTLYIRRHPELFRLHGVMNDVDYSDMRWTVDESADLDLARRLYEHFGHDEFSWRDLLALLADHPDWAALNRSVKQKVVR